MTVRRRLIVLSTGAMLGAGASACLWASDFYALARGEDAAGLGFGSAHLLFFASLPWSIAVWGAMVVVGSLFGLEGPTLLRPFFFSMPIIAGACWAWVGTSILDRRRHSAVKSPVSDRPPGWKSDPLSAFLEMATNNLYATFQDAAPSYKRLAAIDGLFLRAAENLTNPPSVIAPMFLMRSHSALRAAVRLALSGQIPETYMVLRGCLEFALYGIHFVVTPSDYDTWAARHEGPAERKAVRQRFQIATLLSSLRSLGAAEANAASYAYEMLIDLGAHSNMLSVYNSLTVEQGDKELYIETGYLTGKKDSLEGVLRVCAQVGLISVGVMGFAFPERYKTLGIWSKIQELKSGL